MVSDDGVGSTVDARLVSESLKCTPHVATTTPDARGQPNGIPIRLIDRVVDNAAPHVSVVDLDPVIAVGVDQVVDDLAAKPTTIAPVIGNQKPD